ncbi:MAG: flavodoxin [Bacilli bacterium]
MINIKKSLIIYFSRKGENYINDGFVNLEIGNTKVIANMIKDLIDADMFEVEKKEDYPYGYYETTNIANIEKSKNTRPKLKNEISSIDEYDTIYVGYPNWWGTMPMPMFSQLEKLNFKGKKIMPFCTHEGSKMGNSENDLQKICVGADVKKGLAIFGSHVKTSKDQVKAWIKKGE